MPSEVLPCYHCRTNLSSTLKDKCLKCDHYPFQACKYPDCGITTVTHDPVS